MIISKPILMLMLGLSSVCLTQINADEINLPAQESKTMSYSLEQANLSNDALSDWTFLRDKITGDLRLGFGTPIRFSEYTTADESNVEAIAAKFFDQNGKDLGVEKEQLRLVAKNFANNRWFLKYKQFYHGMEVMLSDISITIFKNGNIMSVGAEYYEDIAIPVIPKISYQTAISNASHNSKKEKIKDYVLAKPVLKILPYVVGNSVQYKLVYEHKYETENFNEKFTSFVDANSGDVVWRISNMMHAQREVEVSGYVTEKYSDDEQVEKLFPYLAFSSNTQTWYADDKGKLSENIDEAQVNAYLMGKYAKIYNKDERVPKIPVVFSTDNKLVWDDDNCGFYERNLYYHTNVVYNYFKEIEPGQVFMDFPIDVYVVAGTSGPNAMSAGDRIYFINVDNPSAEMAGSGSVMYHEYGHSMNHFHYYYSGSGNGMINTSCNEALADITSCAILNDPKVGKGVFTEDRERFIRNVDNNRQYPQDMNYDSHYNGQILAGALWDLYKLTDMETLNRVSHFAKYHTPDDPNIGNAFSEWFIACLMADDDDGNMANGTPHTAEIVEAFDMHNIGAKLLTELSFSYTPKTFYAASDESYQIDFDINTKVNIDFLSEYMNIEKAEVIYSDWKKDNFSTVVATQNEDGSFTAQIPEHEVGSILKYYINIKLTKYDDKIRSVSKEAVNDFDLLFVGYKQIFKDDFESDKGWITGADGDDASQGLWEREKPNEILLQGLLLQPEEQITEGGEYCLITDNLGGAVNYSLSYADGRTSIVSPQLDLSEAVMPVLEYYKWIAAINFSPSGQKINSELYLSDDDGLRWTKIDDLNGNDMEWEKRFVIISEFFEDYTDKMRFKFVANGYNGSGSSTKILETLIDDFTILDVDSESSVEDIKESNIRIYPNPVSSILSVRSASYINKIEVIDIYGNILYSINDLNSDYFSWNLEDTFGNKVHSGAYFVKIYQSDKVSVEKIIIQ